MMPLVFVGTSSELIGRTLPPRGAAIVGSAYGNGTFVLSPVTGRGWTSTDGITFTEDAIFGGNISAVDGICYDPDNSQFIAVGDSSSGVGDIWTSPDGKTWTNRYSAAVLEPESVIWDAGMGYGVAIRHEAKDTIRYWTSNATGTSWTTGTQTITGVGQPESLTSNGAGTVVAVGSNSEILTTTNGTSWTQRSAASPCDFYQVIWNGSEFAAVGTLGKIQYSADGITWSLATTNTGENNRCIAWGGNTYVIGTSSGKVFTGASLASPLSQFTNITPSTSSNQFNTVISNDSNFFVAGVQTTPFVYSGKIR